MLGHPSPALSFCPRSPSPPVGIFLSFSHSNPSAALTARHALLKQSLSMGDVQILLFDIILPLQPQACVCTCPLARERNVFPRACACSVRDLLSCPSLSQPHASCLLGLCLLQDSNQSCLCVGNWCGKGMGSCKRGGEPPRCVQEEGGWDTQGGKLASAATLMPLLSRTQLNVKISP